MAHPQVGDQISLWAGAYAPSQPQGEPQPGDPWIVCEVLEKTPNRMRIKLRGGALLPVWIRYPNNYVLVRPKMEEIR